LKNARNRFFIYVFTTIVVVVLIGFLQIAIDGHSESALETGWQTYGTDDKEIRADKLPSLSWSPYTMGKKAVESNKRFVWFRLKMPDYIPQESNLQLYLNDNSIEVYVDENVVYRFGDIDQVGDRIAYGSPFHIIKTPRAMEGQYIYLRMNAFYSGNAGIIRHCYFDIDTNILIGLFRSDIDNLVISFILVISAFVLIIVFYINGAKVSRASYSLAFASFVTGVWMFSETGIKQILYYNPRFWLYVAFSTFFLIPIGYLLYCAEIFAEKKFKRWLRILVVINLVYMAFALVLDLFEIKNIIYTLKPFLFYMMTEMLFLIAVVLHSAYRGNRYAGLFVIGLIVSCTLAFYDILGMIFHVVPWASLRISYGMLVFMFVLLYILVSHIQDMYSLEAANSMEIMAKNQELEALNIELEESQNHLIEANTNLEKEVADRTASLQNLLDNAGQGFLIFGKDMIIDAGCSSECFRIFDKEIRGMDYAEIIHGDNNDSKNYLRNVLQTILQLPDDTYNEKYLSLLPSEVFYKNKILDLKYKIIRGAENKDESVCMVIITDITESKLMHRKMEEEEALMKSIVKVAAYTRDFVEITDSFRYFINTAVPELLESKNFVVAKIMILRKKIHYFKGSFGIFGFRDMLVALNELEAVLKELEKDESLTTERLEEELKRFNLQMELNEIMNYVAKTLSMEFKDRNDSVRVNINRIRQLSSRLEKIPGLKGYATELRQLTYRDFYVLLAKYVVFTESLAERLGKSIERMRIEGGNFLIDITKYEPFTNSLVHIFRNAIDHGIETDVERIKAGKKAVGFIGCRIEQHDDEIWIYIEDDGRGFDFKKLREKALYEGLIKENDIVTEDKLIKFALMGKVSTKEEVSEISGYGLGLSVVMDEIDKLNGKIEIESIFGKQTRIFIKIPLLD